MYFTVSSTVTVIQIYAGAPEHLYLQLSHPKNPSQFIYLCHGWGFFPPPFRVLPVPCFYSSTASAGSGSRTSGGGPTLCLHMLLCLPPRFRFVSFCRDACCQQLAVVSSGPVEKSIQHANIKTTSQHSMKKKKHKVESMHNTIKNRPYLSALSLHVWFELILAHFTTSHGKFIGAYGYSGTTIYSVFLSVLVSLWIVLLLLSLTACLCQTRPHMLRAK